MTNRWMKGLLAVGTLAALSVGVVGADAASDTRKGLMGGKFALTLGSANAGWVTDFTGGDATADFVTEKVGVGSAPKKHITGVKYEDMTISVGSSMGQPLRQWITDSLSQKSTKQSGAVVVANFEDREIERLTFNNALLSDIVFPSCDAASKDLSKIFLSFSPEFVRRTKAGGTTVVGYDTGISKQKAWPKSSFRLKIDGLEDATKYTMKIDSIGARTKVVEHTTGELRDYEKEPGTVAFGNLVVTIPEARADALIRWHEDFVINGHNEELKEKGGTLEYLGANGDTLFTLTFSHLGIFRLTYDRSTGSVATIKAEMYVESLAFR